MSGLIASLALAVVTVVFPVSNGDSLFTAKELEQMCEQESFIYDGISLCHGFIIGMTDAILLMEERNTVEKSFCPPPGIDVTSIAQGALQYIGKNPALFPEPANEVIWDYMIETYHCFGD